MIRVFSKSNLKLDDNSPILSGNSVICNYYESTQYTRKVSTKTSIQQNITHTNMVIF